MQTILRQSSRNLLLLALAGCDACEAPSESCEGGWCFDVELFGDNLAATMDGNTVGWSYVIYQDGQAVDFDSGGMRRTDADPPAMPLSIFDRVNIASSTKTIVTIAALDSLARHNVGLDDSIAPHLPLGWSAGTGVSDITFRQLLAQKSGLRGLGNDLDCTYDGMRGQLAGGYDTSLNGTYDYQNINFCLFRVLLPSLEGTVFTGVSTLDDATTRVAFFDILQSQVFDPAGIADVEGRSVQPYPTLYYGFPDPGWSGIDTGYEEHIAGGGTLHLSTLELAKLIWMLESTSTLLAPAQLADMRDLDSAGRGLGIYADSVTGGLAYHHNGGLDFWGGNWGETLPAGTRTVHYTFPGGLVAALNYTGVGVLGSPNTVMVDAYEDAWYPEGSP